MIALTTFKARGRDSGALVEIPEQHVWTLRDGKVARLALVPRRAQGEEGGGALTRMLIRRVDWRVPTCYKLSSMKERSESDCLHRPPRGPAVARLLLLLAI